MEIVQAQFEGDGAAFLADLLVGFFLDLLNDFLDARRVDAPVGNELLDRLLRDLPPVGIESREDDGAGRVVDDQIDAGGELERADVPALTADDASLEIVARQIDNRDGRLDRVLGGRALDGFGDVVLGAVDGRLAGLGVEPLQQVRGIVTRLAFDLLEQQFLGFVRREACDALQLMLLLGDQPFVFRGGGLGELLPLGDRVFARSNFLVQPLDRSLFLRDCRFAAVHGLLERLRLLALLARLAFGLGEEIVRLFLRVEERLFLPRLGVALGVLREAPRLLLGAADRLGGDALAGGDPPRQHGRRRRDGHQRDDHRTECRQHARPFPSPGRPRQLGRRRVRGKCPAKKGAAPSCGGKLSRKAPLCRVGRSMNLRKQVEPLKQAALQASSHRGMHTTRHRDSLW